jgi:hypothetical protein
MRKLMAWFRSRRPSKGQPFYQADRAEIDRAMREGGRITTGHMTGKMQNQGSQV